MLQVRMRRIAIGAMLASGLMLSAPNAMSANEREVLNGIRAQVAEKPSSARETLIPGVYGLYFPGTEQIGPRAFTDRKLSILGNSATGYAHLSGPRRGQDLSADESQVLYRKMLASLPKERFPTYVFGKGTRQVLLFTAYDCPNCRQVEQAFLKQAKSLDATVYIVPTALRYDHDAQAKSLLKGILCAPDKVDAWSNLILRRQSTGDKSCAEQPDDYARLSRAFPVKFPMSVPTAVTLSDGQIYPQVLARFAEVFGGH